MRPSPPSPPAGPPSPPPATASGQVSTATPPTASSPPSVSPVPSSPTLSLSQNNLSPWSFPMELNKSTGLTTLYLDNTNLMGPIPDIFDSFASLQNVRLSYNNLMGPLPASFANSEIQNIWFHDQTMGLSGRLDVLSVPESVISLPALVNVSLQNNKLQGPYPAFPSSVQKEITTINLANKHLEGTISPAYANLTALKSLYLQQNNLTGPIPDSLTKIATLQTIDVSNNNISGKIPTFGAGVKLITAPGNPFIGTDVNTAPPPPGSSSPSNRASGSGKGYSLSTGIIAAIVVFFVVYKFLVKRKHGKFGRVKNPEAENGMPKNEVICGIGMNSYNGVPSELRSQSSGDRSDRRLFEGGNVSITIDVLRQVTDNFSEANILGRGGFGIVYKGELHDGTKIAVKRMESNSMGTKGLSEFQAEIAVLTKRITIALDVARGVEYLHSLAQQSFIHRDLKPSNILIGDDMRAKVADFGLVKNAPDGKYSLETRLAGTFGHLAPEYAATGRVTTKIDVYAYGVVLMEIITGRKSLDDSMPDEKAHLVTCNFVKINGHFVLGLESKCLWSKKAEEKSTAMLLRNRSSIGHVEVDRRPLNYGI
ncbi:hypothetical protein ACOSQ3_006538 [Xanthoceras sorbifolium]